VSAMRQVDPAFGPAAVRARVQQTEFDPVGVRSEHGDLGACIEQVNAERMRMRRRDHLRSLPYRGATDFEGATRFAE
jgi:hypothetical protein